MNFLDNEDSVGHVRRNIIGINNIGNNNHLCSLCGSDTFACGSTIITSSYLFSMKNETLYKNISNIDHNELKIDKISNNNNDDDDVQYDDHQNENSFQDSKQLHSSFQPLSNMVKQFIL